jgi:hypothetical protein
MRTPKKQRHSAFSLENIFRIPAMGLAAATLTLAVPDRVTAQAYIPATQAFENSPVCSDSDLGNDSDEARGNPEWKTVKGLNIDPFKHVLRDQPTILEGFVAFPPANEGANDQAHAEVSEEDLPWNHYTHDFTIKVTPDPPYLPLLSSWVRFPGASFSILNVPNGISVCAEAGGAPSSDNSTCVVPQEICPDLTTGATCHHTDMEVEWESASLMDEGEGFQRIWGDIPEFAWPAVGDRVWVAGRWIFDCGHPGVPAAAQVRRYVKYSTEIHPPRALVAFRLNHPALDSFPYPRVSAPNFPGPQSYLPVTGVPTTPPPNVPNTGPTNLALTEGDVFVSGNGGGANDLCMILALNGSSCVYGHTPSVILINNVNYVFDIYPPGTDYLHPLPNGTFPITPPVSDASLQWRTVDHFSELPAHTCGGTDTSGCVSANAIFCLIDATTPPPNQTETGCPAVSAARPTRLRIILPFAGTSANFFAQSILLGWDDVPVAEALNRVVRNFNVTLHAFTVKENGESFLHSGDWRVFVNVAGQYRYIDPYFDRDGNGNNKCNGDALTDNGDGDCFLFDATPWMVSVQDGTPIHVAVGGFESDPVDSKFCRQYPPGGNCDPFSFGDGVDLAFENDDRIGTYEFDLQEQFNYRWNTPDGSNQFTTQSTNDGEQYKVEFRVSEIPAPTPPLSAPLQIGEPHFNKFVTSATSLTLSPASPNTEGFQFRTYLQGGPLPTFPSPLPFPVYWNHAAITPTALDSVKLFLSGADGPYLLEYSAENFAQLLEPRHTASFILDNTAPVVSISSPHAILYTHSSVLTLDYLVDDGTGSGVASSVPSMDGAATLPGGVGLQSGQALHLLSELSLGPHTFKVTARDNLNNARTESVSFTVTVTPGSIEQDVVQFRQNNAIKNAGLASSLTAKLKAAATARTAGHCSVASNKYHAFITQLQGQSSTGVTAAAAAIMIADAQYLISHCP